jgi:TolB-like protein
MSDNKREERAPRTAAEWYVALDAQSEDRNLATRCEQWVRRDDSNAQALARCTVVVELARRLVADPELRSSHGAPPSGRRLAISQFARRGARGKLAARLAMMVTLAAVGLVAALSIRPLAIAVPPVASGPPDIGRAARIVAAAPLKVPVVLPGDVVVDPLSLAVLPFATLDVGEGRADGNFAARFDRELSTALATVPGLYVADGRSARAYAETESSARGIGIGLGVRAVVSGAAGAAGGRVQVEADIIDSATGATLWHGRYERPIEGLQALQTELLDRIAETLAEPTIDIDATVARL